MTLLARFGFSGGRRFMTRTFTTSQPWVCPATTNRLEMLVGQGGPGEAATTAPSSATTVAVSFVNGWKDGANYTGNTGWSNVNFYADQATASINNNGSFSLISITQYYHPSFGYAFDYQATTLAVPAVVRGSAYTVKNGFYSSGDVTSSGSAIAYFSLSVPATAGFAVTAFGKSFPGGSGGVSPSPVNYANVPVTPGTSYPITLIAGGSVTITYLE